MGKRTSTHRSCEMRPVGGSEVPKTEQSHQHRTGLDALLEEVESLYPGDEVSSEIGCLNLFEVFWVLFLLSSPSLCCRVFRCEGRTKTTKTRKKMKATRARKGTRARQRTNGTSGTSGRKVQRMMELTRNPQKSVKALYIS